MKQLEASGYGMSVNKTVLAPLRMTSHKGLRAYRLEYKAQNEQIRTDSSDALRISDRFGLVDIPLYAHVLHRENKITLEQVEEVLDWCSTERDQWIYPEFALVLTAPSHTLYNRLRERDPDNQLGIASDFDFIADCAAAYAALISDDQYDGAQCPAFVCARSILALISQLRHGDSDGPNIAGLLGWAQQELGIFSEGCLADRTLRS